MNLVHCKRSAYTVYIGRGGPLGNPFSHLPLSKTRAQVQVQSVEAAVECCDAWVRGNHGALLEAAKCIPPAQRERFLRAVDMLEANDVLGCYCKLGAPCHGLVIMRLWAERNKK